MFDDYWLTLKFVGVAVTLVFLPWLALLLVYIEVARRAEEREAKRETEETKTP